MPEWKQEIRQRLASLQLDPAREAEIVEELAQHLDDRYAELRAGGATQEEAHRDALAGLSEGELLARELRQVERYVPPETIVMGANRRNVIKDLGHDLRYAVRTMRKHPGFTAVVVLTMALGIGVNTAFFSLFNLAFRPLPVNGPGTVVCLMYQGTVKMRYYSYLDYLYFRDHTRVFSGLVASNINDLIIARDSVSEEPQLIGGGFVTDNYFSMLGATTVLGRTFAPEENNAQGQHPVVVLGYQFWQRHFGGDPKIVGKTVRITAKPCVVIGVTTPDFAGLGGRIPEVWLPIAMSSRFQEQINWRTGWFSISGRLKPGRTPEEASAEIQLLSSQLARADSAIDLKARVIVRPLSLFSNDWKVLTIVMTATAMVLLIACSNIANMMLARAARRQKEIGVRLCLGASRSRLVRQLLTESLLLAALGGGAGILLAWWSLKAFLTSALLSQVPNVDAIILFLDPDARVLTFTFFLSLLAGMAFGLLPALRATRTDLVSTLKDDGAAFGGRLARSRLRNGLVVAQVALSMVLLIISGLLLRGFIRSSAIDPGFEGTNLLYLSTHNWHDRFDRAREQQIRERLIARFESLPGVKHVSWALGVPPQKYGTHGDYFARRICCGWPVQTCRQKCGLAQLL